MSIAPALLREYPELNDAQKEIVSYGDGQLLVIAGPGSGKSFSLVLRTINLLLLGKAEPGEIILCTFTEKAAFELRDRLADAARKVDYHKDLSQLKIGTIHGICNTILLEHRHRTPVGSGYETLDELTQLLFIFDHFDEIVDQDASTPYFGRWQTKWRAIKGLRDYFNKITEELIDPVALCQDADAFISQLGQAYSRYCEMLFGKNRIDFGFQQKLIYNLLLDRETCEKITAHIRYVLVDEYQDTNYIQEQVLLKLASKTNNLCVVGDEDQSLYRFRGATVRNILEFPNHFPNCKIIKLTTNYRSHERIVRAYDRWMASADWTNPLGQAFRYEKEISPDPKTAHGDYPAIFAIWGQHARDEASRFADFVAFLKQENIIADYSQVALLLRSVRLDHSGPFLEALEKKGIPAFCPRARAYFDNEEIKLMVACFALLLGYHGNGRGNLVGKALMDLAGYVDACIVALAGVCQYEHPLARLIREFAAEIAQLREGESLDRRLADYFYRFLALPPFSKIVQNDNKARNLAIFSQLLDAFQRYYHYPVVTFKNHVYLRFHFFNSFLRLLHEGGINEYEDPFQPFPKGHVQVMTIHQSKGLEFPVVVVGSLAVQISTGKIVDRDLRRFYHRPPFEPENRVTVFDRMRLHYVAFSRAEKVLALTTHQNPKPHFSPIWQGLPQWPYVQKEVLTAQKFAIKERIPLKRSYSFTGDLKIYQTCPRQYQFFREYDFTPSRSAVIFFGLLVHQTIEEIHRIVLDGKLASIDRARIRDLFEKTFYFLSLTDVRPIGPKAKEAALQQVLHYFTQNQEEMQRVIETEIDVSVEKNDYILTGKVDLLLGKDGKLELLDFKTSEKPVDSPALLVAYEQQLCTYAHILERRYGKKPERLLLYWTAEKRKADALLQFPYRPELVDEAGRQFDAVVKKIQCRNFQVITVPEKKICSDCDFRHFCAEDGLI